MLWTVVLKKTFESPLDCKEIQPVHSKGDQSWVFIGRTDAEAETPILWPPDEKNQLIWKDPDSGKDWREEEKGMTKNEMVGWHLWLNGHEFGWTPGVGDGQGGLACCSPWGWKELDTPEWLIELRLVEGKNWEIFPIKCSLVCWLACHITFFLKPPTIHYLLFSVFFFLSSRNSKQLSVINPRRELNYTYFSCHFSVV